jgi:hypothetical protein
VCTRVGADVDGRNLGTAGNASKIGDTCGSESEDASDMEADAVERGRSEELLSVRGPDSATVKLCGSTGMKEVCSLLVRKVGATEIQTCYVGRRGQRR